MKKVLTNFPISSILASSIFVLIIIILYFFLNNKKIELSNNYINRPNPTVSIAQTKAPTNTPTPTDMPTPTDKPTPTVTLTPTPTTDPDPIVTCLINSKCGGGTEQLRESVCKASTCCQMGDSYIFYLDKSKCANDQQNFVSKYLSPSPTPTPTAIPTPTRDPYCDSIQVNWKQAEQNLQNQQIYHYANPAQELQTLYIYLQAYQQQANLHNCGITLSL
jgi:hypothetical protein